MRENVTRFRLPLVYANLVGGQDELVFDGASFVLDAHGQPTHMAPQFEERMMLVDFVAGAPQPGEVAEPGPLERQAYGALVLGVRDLPGELVITEAPDKVNIIAEAAPDQLDKIRAQDITAFVDLSEAKEGRRSYRVQWTAPSKLNPLLTLKQSAVWVSVARRKERMLPIEVIRLKTIAPGLVSDPANDVVEPEEVKIGRINGRTIAFIGLERANGSTPGLVLAFDLSGWAPGLTPTFLGGISSATLGRPEGLVFWRSGGQAFLGVADEQTGNVSVFALDIVGVPVPATLALFGLGALSLAAARRIRRG